MKGFKVNSSKSFSKEKNKFVHPKIENFAHLVFIEGYSFLIIVSIGKDTIITIESKQPDGSAFQRSPDTLGATGTPALQNVEIGSQVVGQPATTTETSGRSVDIVKSIVYGGLMESITSLSVVSSAAGADAAICKHYIPSFCS